MKKRMRKGRGRFKVYVEGMCGAWMSGLSRKDANLIAARFESWGVNASVSKV